MNGINFAAYIRKQTRTTSATLSNSDLLAYANKAKDEIAGAIIQKDENYFLVPEVTNLVANQREYSLPTETANRIRRVEAMLGGSGTDYIKLKTLNQGQYVGSHDEVEITSNFGNAYNKAFYEINRFSIYLYTGTVPSVTDGLKLWAFDYPADIVEAQLSSTTDLSVDPTTTSFALPRAVHGIWAERVIIEWKNGQAKPIPLTKDEMNWEQRREEALAKLTPVDADEAFQANIPSQNERGNSGFDY